MNEVTRNKLAKLWTHLGVCVATSALGVVHVLTADSAAARADDSVADVHDGGSELKKEVNAAREKILDGEGGEDGLGLSRSWPRVSAPALTNEQIKKAIIGNTLRRNDEFAAYFNPNGTVEGWETDYNEVAVEKCPKKDIPGDSYFLEPDGQCWQKTELKMTGTWQVQGNQFCNKLNWETGEWDRCFHVFMLLDQFGFFDVNTGKMEGKGQFLAKGKVLDIVK